MAQHIENTTHTRDGALNSPWQLPTGALVNHQTPTGKIYDCLIIGAGITGLTAAVLLQQQGKQVALADAHNVGFGTTGGTSAHINTFADTTYPEAESAFGEDGAILFADAINDGAGIIKQMVTDFNIDCQHETKTGYLYAETEDEAKQLDDIYNGFMKVGVAASYTENAPTPVAYIKALEIPNQAQFHPIEYLMALKDAFLKAGGHLFENTLIDKLEHEDNIHTALSAEKSISAKKIVYATHLPPGITVFSFKCAPYRSYVLAVTLQDDDYPDALIYDSQEPYHYVRTHQINGQKLLLIGGNEHKTGHDDPEQAFADLEAYTRQYYNVAEIKYRWSSQYYIPADGLPYVGQIPFMADGIYTATGFNGNGMMLGSISGKILAEMALGVESKYDKIFSSSRIKPIDGFTEFMKENADVAYRFVADRFGVEEKQSLQQLQPGTGQVVESNDKKMAVYRDKDGTIHALDPVCTHAGCIVNFNAAECTWDCPCHGGRFAIDGSVLTGPPTKGLEQIL
ncbi:FAD-dependent oxidoreductase [Mucilaginibacter auburnensis]|uniref:Glycine/D-amino acid oxidase-like deaminating enzyme n=1 Tax=Mucilaginibacter auburnensis TaxID=1457233 RepID=A0A2H9VNV1_9SPHI|nr:FAD-dependent oxidoreductase [Mucilaginibacter auburnensis]PJJ80029.1 glycine/D-amino acid oxidase-like deaminating enzyme [Mucilaginibacter auburnensis]